MKEHFSWQGSVSLKLVFESLSLERLEKQYELSQLVKTDIMQYYSKTVYDLKHLIFDEIQKLTFDLNLYA